MTEKRIYIASIGIVSPLGKGLAATEAMLRDNRSAIGPLDLFPLLQGAILPVGQVHEHELDESSPLPRTHRLARLAALQAMDSRSERPEAVILGTTTGGILTTEQLLRDTDNNKEHYRYHGIGSVATSVAEAIDCCGPALTVSTACSSGAVAIALAMAMLRHGKAKTVLAGGADSLCRLTYFGFHSLQLVDRNGCRPFDADRHGMAVAEGAALLLLTTEKPEAPLAELLGAGLSCDAYHPAAPHPEGRGARMAMQAALADAGLTAAEIDYINLHGTGTPENDLAEAKAIQALFITPPPLSSIKGATGHSLAASGAIEAAVATIAVAKNFLPANTGCTRPDPAFGLLPLLQPASQRVSAVLSNSFGFGGNNGSLVIGAPDTFPAQKPAPAHPTLAVHGSACLTGAGEKTATTSLFAQGLAVAGMVALECFAENLPARFVRRLKRLPRMTLSLAVAAQQDSGFAGKPAAIFMGTGWGALSETYDFLARLTESQEQFPSPTDFVGSVHNGPAGQTAILLGATGANITTGGGDYSFEQALFAADLLLGEGDDDHCLVLGADEGHQTLSPLLDPSIAPGTPLADGGGALCLSRKKEGAHCLLALPFYQRSTATTDIDALIDALGGAAALQGRCALLLAGIPAAEREAGEAQLERFIRQTHLDIPVIRYRELLGEFASASAVAAAIAASLLTTGDSSTFLGKATTGDRNTILVLGLGHSLSVMDFSRP